MKAKLLNISTGENIAYTQHNNCIIKDGQYGYYNKKDNKFVPLGMSIDVLAILIDLETAEKTLCLRICDSHGVCTEVKMSRENLTEQKILSLVKYGAQVDKKSAPILIGCIENEEVNAPVLYQHNETGFYLFNEIEVFRADSLIGSKEFRSEYIGNMKIKPYGSLDKWLEMVKEEVMGSYMEVILASSLSAVVLDYIHKEFPVENLVLSLVGDSSSGKTTALNLAVSTGALPSTTDNSLLLTFLDTEMSIMHRIASGYPVGIDEGSVLKKDITGLLYSIANGKERARMTKELQIAESAEFHTVIFTSSEISLLALADNNSGLRVRIIELNEVWTKSGESADKIKQVTCSNYGHAIPKFAEYLLKVGKDKVIDKCKKYTDSFLKARDNFDEDVLIGRLAKKIGIILATAQMAKEALGLLFDIELIKEFFAEHIYDNPEEYDIGIKAHDAVTAYCTEHPEEFGENIPMNDEDIYLKNGYFGVAPIKTLYNGITSGKVLYIKKETFEKIMDSYRFRDCKVVLKRFRELGLLESGKDRYISKFHIGKGSSEILVKGYKIRMIDDEVPIEDEGFITECKPVKYNKSKKKAVAYRHTQSKKRK